MNLALLTNEAEVAEFLQTHNPIPKVGLFTNMVMSINGSYSQSSTSQLLSDPIDRIMLKYLREQADLLLVGAATIRSENYQPPQKLDGTPLPLAIISKSKYPPTNFSLTSANPMMLSPKTGSQVDLVAAIAKLREAGYEKILSEGGPSIISQLHRLDLVDVSYRTISPVLASDPTPSIQGAHPDHLVPQQLRYIAQSEEGLLFTRWDKGYTPGIKTT